MEGAILVVAATDGPMPQVNFIVCLYFQCITISIGTVVICHVSFVLKPNNLLSVL